MNAQLEREVADWLARSHDDRFGAELVLPHGLFDLACFLAQQAAEKALRGLLASLGEKPEKTHDLEAIIAKLATHGVNLSALLADAAMLSPMAVLVRYPGFGHMNQVAAQDALAACDRICAAVAVELATP